MYWNQNSWFNYFKFSRLFKLKIYAISQIINSHFIEERTNWINPFITNHLKEFIKNIRTNHSADYSLICHFHDFSIFYWKVNLCSKLAKVLIKSLWNYQYSSETQPQCKVWVYFYCILLLDLCFDDANYTKISY